MEPDSTSTLGEERSRTAIRRARDARRLGVAALAAVVLSGMLGVVGPTVGQISAENGDLSLTLAFPQRTRSGQPAPLTLHVTRPGGFDEPLVVRLDRGFVALLDFQNFYPVPASELGDPDAVEYEFDPPDGSTFALDLDARAQPDMLFHRETFTLSAEAGASSVSVRFPVTVMP